MANYSRLNFSSCLEQHHNYISSWGTPNPCVPPPSSFNPYNITNLADFKISMLQEIISNTYFGLNLAICSYAAKILPPTFVGINNVSRNPQHLDIAALTLQNLTQKTLPYPLNESDHVQ